MRLRIRTIYILLCSCSVFGLEPNYRHSDQLLIKLKRDAKLSDIPDESVLLQDLKLTFGHYAVLQVRPDRVDQVMDELDSRAEVEYVEPHYIYQSVAVVRPNDPLFSKLWGLENSALFAPSPRIDIEAIRAWQIVKGNKSIKIGIIDSGVDYSHPDLKDNIWVNLKEKNGTVGVDDDGNGLIDDLYGYDFANKDGDPNDDNHHGTHVAGIIGAVHNNQIGVAGVMPEVSLVALKFLDKNGAGDTSDAIAAIDYAIKNKIDVLNNSWGGGGYSRALYDAIKAAGKANIPFIVAAGNSSTDNDQYANYPANYNLDNVISVASFDSSDNLSAFSCYGASSVHLAAPGSDIYSTLPNGLYGYLSGTSMAAPHVTGAIGLLISKEGKMPPKVIRDRLMSTTVRSNSYRQKSISEGRLDAYQFLANLPSLPLPPLPVINWINYQLPQVIGTSHPYANNIQFDQIITIPGAKKIRLIFKRFEFEENYDYLYLFDKKKKLIQTLSGSKSANFTSEVIEGDTVYLTATSDSDISFWGYEIDQVQYEK